MIIPPPFRSRLSARATPIGCRASIIRPGPVIYDPPPSAAAPGAGDRGNARRTCLAGESRTSFVQASPMPPACPLSRRSRFILIE